MAKRALNTDFSPTSVLATSAVAKYLGLAAKTLDEADQLGVLVGFSWTARGDEDRGVSSWQSMKSTWRDICKDRGRPCVIAVRTNKAENVGGGKWRDTGEFGNAEVTLSNHASLRPISHWLFLAADQNFDSTKAKITWKERGDAVLRAKHLVFEKSPTVSSAVFVGTEAGLLLWESFLDNVRTNPVWRAALKAGPLPSPALATPASRDAA